MEKKMFEVSLDELEKRGINRYKAVVMAAQEARFLNEQARLGLAKLDEKPTTAAIRRLFDGQVLENETNDSEG
jgi:DNA-directed RNA polymerase omega subunit